MPGIDVSTITPDYNFNSCAIRATSGVEFWISSSLLNCSISDTSLLPTEYTITLSAAALADATTLSVDATTVALKKYDVLYFTPSNVLVVLSANANVGATTLNVFAITGAIADNAEALTYGLTPVFSINNFTKNVTGNQINSRLFSSPVWDLQKTISRSYTASISGDRVSVDAGADLLEAASLTTDYIYWEMRHNKQYGNIGYAGAATVSSSTDTLAVDSFENVSYELAGAGPLLSYKPLGMS